MAESSTLSLFACSFVLLGLLGSIVACVSPYWFTNKKFPLHYGIFTYTVDDEISIMPGPWFVIKLPETILFTLGLVLCFFSSLVSSVYVCCFKSGCYKLCYAAGFLGLLSVASFFGLFVKLCPRFKSQKVGWTVVLCIFSAFLVLLASIFHLVVGRRERSKSRTSWSCYYFIPIIC